MWKSRVLEHRSLSSTVGRSAIETKGKLKYRRISFRGWALGHGLQHRGSWTCVTQESISRLIQPWPSSETCCSLEPCCKQCSFGKVWRGTSWKHYPPFFLFIGWGIGEIHVLLHYLSRPSQYAQAHKFCDSVFCLENNLFMIPLRSSKELSHGNNLRLTP